jgi:hypothetical protein
MNNINYTRIGRTRADEGIKSGASTPPTKGQVAQPIFYEFGR